jgi:serine-type D-Ala-D-Ala carboxypeptidase/endopeptidase (penicillin-binding protein 4)
LRGSAHRGGAGVRLTRWAALAGCVAIALGACGGTGRTSKSESLPAAARTPPAQSTTASDAASGASGRASSAPLASGKAGASPGAPATPSSALTRLRKSLTRSLRKAGPQSGALVYDLTAGRPLVALRVNVGRSPASLEKLYTTLAAVQMLGPNARLHTAVVGKGHMGGRGVWHGNLYLVGGGDPTFGDGAFNKVWESGYGPTAAQLVHQLTARGIHAVTGRVIGDESLFDRRRGGMLTDLDADLPDFGGQLSALVYDHGATTRGLNPAAFAARELTLVLRADHIRARASTKSGDAPARGHVLAVVSSPPLAMMLRLMDVPSDDLFAELLAKQLGARFGSGGSIADGAQVISSTISTSYGVHPRILDGSGLSRSDRSSPREVVQLLRAAWGTPDGKLLVASLPVVGIDGTVRTIAVHTPAQHNCVAKTGTLNYVTNLAGYCLRRGHHKLAFALMVDGPANWRALMLEGQMLAAIARY